MTYSPLFKEDKPHFHTSGGELAVGYGIYTYYAGTNTPVAMYSDPYGSTQYQNPIVLDSRGEPSGQGIYADPEHTYKVILKDANGGVVWSMDNVSAAGSGGGSSYTKQYFLLHQMSTYPAYIKSSDVQKLKIVPSGADVSMSDNFIIDTENNEIRGLDPSKKYLVNASFMFDNGGTLAPHHVHVSGTQWCGTNYYNEIITDPAIDTTEWRSMSWVIAYKDSLSIYVSGSADASDSSYVTMWLRDLQILEIG